MIFRRFAQHLRQQNWAEVTVEFTLLVLGVFLGLQAQDWADERAERSEERMLLSSLRTEFVEVQGELQRQLDKHRQIDGDVAYVLTALGDAEQRGQSQAAVINSRMAWTLVGTTTQLSQGELNSLLSTGRLGLLQNTELRSALADWGGVLEDATEDEVRSRVMISEQLEPMLWRLMDVRAIRDYQAMFGRPDGTDTSSTSEVPVNRELMGALSTRRFWAQHILREFQGPIDESKRIIELIDTSLGD
ncbi:MAG TPA: hypothetical protein P5171_11165 [Xanthomonadaceae bacterium]|nr:hypothetical protein [Xanthomonadaceae bacterium]